jgi:hypothetical protein
MIVSSRSILLFELFRNWETASVVSIIAAYQDWGIQDRLDSLMNGFARQRQIEQCPEFERPCAERGDFEEDVEVELRHVVVVEVAVLTSSRKPRFASAISTSVEAVRSPG